MSETIETRAVGADGAPALERVFRNPIAILGFGGVSLVLYLVAMVWDQLGTPWGAASSMAMAVAAFVLHVALSGRRLSSMDPLIWVPVFMLLFYFGTPVAVEVMGFSDYYRAFGYVPKLEVAYAINLMGFTAFFLGAHSSGILNGRKPVESSPPGSRPLLIPALLVIIAGMLMTLFGLVIAGPGVLFGAYMDLKLAEADGTAQTSWFNVGLLTIPPACMALLAAREPGNRWIPVVVTVIVGVVFALLVLIGDRGGLAIQVLGLGWIVTQRVRRVPYWIAIVGFTAALVLMPILKEFRNYRNLQESVRLSPYELVAATFYETGSSGLVFAWTVDAVPNTRPYDYGASIAMPIVFLVPWIGSTIPDLGRLAGELNPNFWISEHIDPASYEVKGANHGFTMTGTWYSNFGITGVLVLSALMGALTSKMRNMARGTPMQATMSGLFVVFLALFIRNSLATPLRFAFWPLLLIVIAYYVSPFLFGRPASSAIASGGMGSDPQRRPGELGI